MTDIILWHLFIIAKTKGIVRVVSKQQKKLQNIVINILRIITSPISLIFKAVKRGLSNVVSGDRNTFLKLALKGEEV
ncbi:MAG TPA: hypothetical protein DCZ63_15065 [Geobacter sp.]|nr:hypothetical protein [Geobacter sp.]